MKLLEHNRIAWNHEVKIGNQWTIPVSDEQIQEAKKGLIKIVLTPFKVVPKEWLGDIVNKNVLCLASGGGQQGPILAAAGSNVTVFDNSDKQLEQDDKAALNYHLKIKTIKGNMQDLSIFSDNYFDLIIHPVSNCFIDDIKPVWREAYRVLKKNGKLLSGFINPIVYMINWDRAEKEKKCLIENTIPYSDLKSFSNAKKKEYIENMEPFEFGHSLTDQINGQIEAGFIVSGFYEDKGEELLDKFTSTFIATKAEKVG